MITILKRRKNAMDINKKFHEVMGGFDFRYSEPVDSPEQLIKLGDHILAQYESLGEERRQRCHDLIGIFLADMLQQRALARYHEASFDSIQHILDEACVQSGAYRIWRKDIELAKQAIADLGLNRFQVEELNNMFDRMPDIVVELLALHVSRFSLLPRENATAITSVLQDMLQEEAGHDKPERHN
jgi:hypothetical protein